jgi:hypothetical protein
MIDFALIETERKLCTDTRGIGKYGSVCFFNFTGVATILCAKDSVPKSEIEPVVQILSLMVNRMMRWTDHPVSEPVMGKADWQAFNAEVIHNGPNAHRR